MNLYYLDASAWLKRYLAEPGANSMRRLFSRQPALACSVLGRVEVVAALSRRNHAKHDLGRLSASLADAEQIWPRFLQIETSEQIAERASRLALRLGLRGADAIHLSSALYLNGLPHGCSALTFVCADRELNEAADTVGLATLDPTNVS